MFRQHMTRTATRETFFPLVGYLAVPVTQSSFTASRSNLRLPGSLPVERPLGRFTRVRPGNPPIPTCVINTDTSCLEPETPMPMVNSA